MNSILKYFDPVYFHPGKKTRSPDSRNPQQEPSPWRIVEKVREEVENIREEKLLTLAEKEKAHATLLSEILDSHQHTVMEQAKHRPDKFMKQTQIRHINEILQEIREMLAGSNASRYLHLAEEPREDDLEHYPGTTYGEMDILLNAYGQAMSARRYNRLYWEAEEYSKEEKDEEQTNNKRMAEPTGQSADISAQDSRKGEKRDGAEDEPIWNMLMTGKNMSENSFSMRGAFPFWTTSTTPATVSPSLPAL